MVNIFFGWRYDKNGFLVVKRRRFGLSEPKRRRFMAAIIFFLNSAYIKTMSFWTARVQNGVILD